VSVTRWKQLFDGQPVASLGDSDSMAPWGDAKLEISTKALSYKKLVSPHNPEPNFRSISQKNVHLATNDVIRSKPKPEIERTWSIDYFSLHAAIDAVSASGMAQLGFNVGGLHVNQRNILPALLPSAINVDVKVSSLPISALLNSSITTPSVDNSREQASPTTDHIYSLILEANPELHIERLAASNNQSQFELFGDFRLAELGSQIPFLGQIEGHIQGLGPMLLTFLNARQTRPELTPGIPLLLLLEGLGTNANSKNIESPFYDYHIKIRPEGVIHINDTPIALEHFQKMKRRPDR